MYNKYNPSAMKKEKSIIKGIPFAVLCVFYYGALLVACPGKANASPVVSIDNEVHDFGTVLEGIVLTHDYIVENKGNEPLLIPRVRSTCACAVADYSKEVLPGQKGSITVEFDSKGSGGMTVDYKIRVETNDPGKGAFDLTLTGHVDPIAIITPERAILTGNVGKKIETELAITSDARNPFKIISAEPMTGKDISYSLKEIDGSKPIKYLLTVKNIRKEKGTYRDYITLKTDSDVRPAISIKVQGDIQD
jgi:Protein of unknown function (DUF1573)